MQYPLQDLKYNLENLLMAAYHDINFKLPSLSQRAMW